MASRAHISLKRALARRFKLPENTIVRLVHSRRPLSLWTARLTLSHLDAVGSNETEGAVNQAVFLFRDTPREVKFMGYFTGVVRANGSLTIVPKPVFGARRKHVQVCADTKAEPMDSEKHCAGLDGRPATRCSGEGYTLYAQEPVEFPAYNLDNVETIMRDRVSALCGGEDAAFGRPGGAVDDYAAAKLLMWGWHYLVKAPRELRDVMEKTERALALRRVLYTGCDIHALVPGLKTTAAGLDMEERRGEPVCHEVPFEHALPLVASRGAVLTNGAVKITESELRSHVMPGIVAKEISLDLLEKRLHVHQMDMTDNVVDMCIRPMVKKLLAHLWRDWDSEHKAAVAIDAVMKPHTNDVECWKIVTGEACHPHLKYDQRRSMGQLYHAVGVPLKAALGVWEKAIQREAARSGRAVVAVRQSYASYWRAQRAHPPVSVSCLAMARNGLCPVASKSGSMALQSPAAVVQMCRQAHNIKHSVAATPVDMTRAARKLP